MSEYICTVRSNYFHVKDPTSFRSFMGRVYGSVDRIFLWQEQDAEGRADIRIWLLRSHCWIEESRGGR